MRTLLIALLISLTACGVKKLPTPLYSYPGKPETSDQPTPTPVPSKEKP